MQVLEGQKVLPVKAKQLGFSYRYPYVQDALRAIARDLWLIDSDEYSNRSIRRARTTVDIKIEIYYIYQKQTIINVGLYYLWLN